jgi:hypothetical protein
MSFKFYDGDTGSVLIITGFVDDGQFLFVHDQDELAILRFESEGGLCIDEAKKQADYRYVEYMIKKHGKKLEGRKGKKLK